MRKRQFRLQRFSEAFERCRCVHDVHSCFKCTTFLNSRFASGYCVSVVFLHVGTGRCGEQVDVLRGLDVSDFSVVFSSSTFTCLLLGVLLSHVNVTSLV